MAEQQSKSSGASSTPESEDLQIGDLRKSELSPLDNRRPSSDVDRSRLTKKKTALEEQDQAYPSINTSLSGEKQFRVPSRRTGGTSDLLKLEEPGKAERILLTKEQRAQEQSQMYSLATRSDNLQEAHMDELEYGTRPTGQRRSDSPSPGVQSQWAVEPTRGRNLTREGGCNRRIMGSSHDLPMSDFPMMGERISQRRTLDPENVQRVPVREQVVRESWRNRDQRKLSLTLHSNVNPGGREDVTMHQERGSRGNSSRVYARPSVY
jgi:hypothetical protein